jgi:hypothetical protein
MTDITTKNTETKIFIPYKLDTFKTLQYKDLELLEFDDVIDKIEEYVKNLRNKEKKTMKINNNRKINNNISIGIDIDERKKIKINKMKGDSLIKYYNNLVNRLKKFLELVNNKIESINNDDYIKEDQNTLLVKFFSKVRYSFQPNCNNIKYKKGFPDTLTNKNANEINQEMEKEFQKCLEHLLKIIIDYCMGTAILTNETQSILNKEVLFYKEETEKEKMKRLLKNNSNNKQQPQQPQQQYQHFGNLFRGGKKTKTKKYLKSKSK